MTALRRTPESRTLIGGTAGSVVGLYPGVLPRPALFEGALVGVCATIGICLAALACALIPACRRRRTRPPAGPSHLVLAGCGGTVAAAVAWAAQWRILTYSTPGHTATATSATSAIGYWAVVLSVAATLAAVLAILGAIIRRAGRALPHLPARATSTVAARPARVHTAVRFGARAGVSLALLVAVAVPAGATSATPAAGNAGATSTLVRPAVPPTRSGAPGSAIAWNGLGPHGRRFVSDTAYPGSVRVYAGLATARDIRTRAAAAADDLVRAGGLDASAVVVMVPTGSGWVDGTAARAIEERFDGDVAEVAMQYSAVPSWVEYLFDLDGAVDAARALLTAVVERMSRLPAPERPGLHVYGESLGAAAGSRALADAPAAQRLLCSALWVGPPGGFTDPTPRRSTVVANATDPVPHWSPELAVRPHNRHGSAAPWLPIVSFLQTSADLLISRAAPEGAGHVYGAGQVSGMHVC